MFVNFAFFTLCANNPNTKIIDLRGHTVILGLNDSHTHADWDFFWRHQLADGIYFPSGRLNIAGNDSKERFIGHQVGFQLGFAVNRHLELSTSIFHFLAGGFLDDVTDGRNFTQIGFSAGYRF